MRDQPSLTVTTSSGRVVITGEDRPDIVVEGKAAMDEGDGGGVVVRASSSSLAVRCPAGTDVRVGTSSGGVELRGRLGDARVTTSSSSIRVENVDALELRSSSGSIEGDTCVGYCRLQAASRRGTRHGALMSEHRSAARSAAPMWPIGAAAEGRGTVH